MDIDRDLERLIETDIDHWQERKHAVVFEYAGEYNDVVAGELYVDGRPIRPLPSGACGWVNLNEARLVAQRLGVSLQMA